MRAGRSGGRHRCKSYFGAHLVAVGRAIEPASRLKGYFRWSYSTTSSGRQGYCARFGLVYVDYETLERVPKASYHWYRDLIAGAGSQASL